MKDNLAEHLLKALEAAEIAWWEMRLPSGTVQFGKIKTDILGYKSSEFKHYEDFTNLVNEADYEPMMQAMRDHMEGKRDVYEAIFRIMGADGKERTFYDRGRIVERKNGEIVIAGATTNIATVNGYLFKVLSKPYEPISS